MKKTLVLALSALLLAAIVTTKVMSQSPPTPKNLADQPYERMLRDARPSMKTSQVLINDVCPELPKCDIEVKDGKHFHRIPGIGKVPSVINGTIFASATEPAPLPRLDDQVRSLQRQIDDKLQQMQKSNLIPAAKDVELRVALAKYLADEKLTGVLEVLEQIVKDCPGTIEAEKAAAALLALKAVPLPAACEEQEMEIIVPSSAEAVPNYVDPAEVEEEDFR